MKETAFIDQNKDKWQRFQKISENNSGNPEEIADLYADITSDLSYAQTFYDKRTVRIYLNQLAQSVHNLVHKQRKDSWTKLFSIWKVSLPLEVYRSRKNLLFALSIFLLWAFVGVISSIYIPNFVRYVLGDGYVEMTIENIQKGDPLGVYHSSTQISMFLEITLNNIRVAFLTFIFGFFFTIGTHIFIFNNAVMLGAFQGFFYTKGLLLTSFLGIWIHGAFEISAIVIAGGAGITLGNGFLFPGSYTRLQSLQFAARRGLKIMIALIPFLIVAGFLESFVTHQYQVLPEWSKWSIILLSFSIILFYFVIYPSIVARKYPELIHEKNPPVRLYKNTFELNKIRKFNQLFQDSFAFYRVHILAFVRVNLLLTLPLIIALLIAQDYTRYNDIAHEYEYDWLSQLGIIMGFTVKSGYDFLATLGWSFILCIWGLTIFYQFEHQSEKLNLKQLLPVVMKRIFPTWIGSLVILFMLFYVPWYWMLLLLFAAPFFWLQGITCALDDSSFFTKYKRGISYSTKYYGTILLSIVVMCLVLFLFAQPLALIFSSGTSKNPDMPDLLDKIAGFTKNIARYYTEDFVVPANIIRQVFYIAFLFFTLPLFLILMGFQYFAVREQQHSIGLRKQFESFGKRKRNQEKPIDFE